MATEVIRKATVEELVAHRARAIERFEAATEAAKEATEAGRRAAATGYAPGVYINTGSRTYGGDTVEKYRQDLDRAIWSHVLTILGLRDLMDKAALEEFERSLKDAPPEATAENIFATIRDKIERADEIFERGAVNAFASLDRSFRSHDGFKLGSRIILSGAISAEFGWWNHYAQKDATLRDVQRVFHVLDGKPIPERGVGCITQKIQSAVKAKERLVEDDFFRVRVFENGNLHVWFKRDDLVEKVNRMIAKHFGATLGNGGARAR